ncbi:hypothetical protein BVRB_025260, partial [Beta vulgaris subsp. vulgaris]
RPHTSSLHLTFSSFLCLRHFTFKHAAANGGSTPYLYQSGNQVIGRRAWRPSSSAESACSY